MDPEKSSNSSFEDLSNMNEGGVTSNVTNESNGNPVNVTVEENKEKVIEDGRIDILDNGEIIKEILFKADTEERPQPKDFATIKLIGKLENGTIVEENQEMVIQVGDFEVVQGLDIAITMMRVREIARITLNSRFAYGSIGLKNIENPEKSIPPYAKIIYEVELLSIKSEDEVDVDTFEMKKKLGNSKRERANFWYNRNEFNLAIQLYRRALEYLDETRTDGEESDFTNKQLQELLDDRLIVYNNLAMAQIKISAFDAALISVENVLRCQPDNSKALFRKGRILDAKGDTKGAIALLQKAATLEPESKSIQQDLGKLILKNRREERNEKEMYQKMLGQARRLEESNEPSPTRTIDREEMSRFRLLTYLMGSILIGVAGVALYRFRY